MLSPSFALQNLIFDASTDLLIKSAVFYAEDPKTITFELRSSSGAVLDDTTHNERIHEYHKTGTFYEVDKAGIKTTRIVANNYTIVAGDDNVHIKGIVNLTIDSHCHTYIKGNWKVQVNGNKYETIHGNNTITGSSSTSPVGGVDFDGTHTHTISSSGGGTEARPTNLALMYIIKF